jgi:CubicO group peptidase (beta-lactamase class C family)
LAKREGKHRTPGFDIPTPGGSTGGGWSDTTVGHLGFTGTAFWIDPSRDRSAILLTNRTFPDGEDRGIKVLRQWFFGWASQI